MSRDTLILDTHVWIWIVEGAEREMSAHTIGEVRSAAERGAVRVSAVSAWEVAMAVRKQRLRLAQDPASWVERALTQPGFAEVPLDSTVAVAATSLPGRPPADPANRFLISTAFANGWTLVTCDAQIIAYADRERIPVLDARP